MRMNELQDDADDDSGGGADGVGGHEDGDGGGDTGMVAAEAVVLGEGQWADSGGGTQEETG